MATGLPRPEPSPAGKLVGDMKRDRGFALLLRLLVGFIFAAALALAVASASPTRAWARTVPTTVAAGDPTGGEDSPRPGPKKATTLGIGPQGSPTSSAKPSSRPYSIWRWLDDWKAAVASIRARYLL